MSGCSPSARTGSTFLGSWRAARWFNSNQAHHATVFVFEKMAVIDESADRIWIAKIHAQADAGILQVRGAVEGDVDGVAQERLVDGDSIPSDQHEMQLMDVEGVQFRGAIFDDPVFDVALFCDDVRDAGGGIEWFGRLTIHSEVKRGGAIGIVGIEKCFREIELAGADGSHVSQPGLRGRRKWHGR